MMSALGEPQTTPDAPFCGVFKGDRQRRREELTNQISCTAASPVPTALLDESGPGLAHLIAPACRKLIMLENMRRELQIRQVLRKLARQRVTLILQPHNVWVIEKALTIDADTDAHLKTCYMRGWIEQLEHAIPTGKLSSQGELPDGNLFTEMAPMYRLTDSGWSVINRSHQFTLLTVFLALLTLIATVS